MPASLVVMGTCPNVSLEKMSYGPDDWSAIHSATNTALSCGPAAAAGQQHFCRSVTLSVSADLSAAKVFTIKDGSTILHQEELAVNFRSFQRVFSPPLQATVGAALTANMEASGAAIQTVIMKGFTTPANSAVTV